MYILDISPLSDVGLVKKKSFPNLVVAVLPYCQCPLPCRSFTILLGPICWFLILEHSFSVSDFMWRFLIYLDLSFLQGDKNGSICILLHADHQLNQHNLLKILPFFHWMVLAPLSNIKWPKCVGSFLDFQFYSIELPASLSTVIPKRIQQ